MKPVRKATVIDEREAYLAIIAFQIQRRLAPGEVFETIQELREHLDANSAAYQELGMEAVAAMKAAIEAFGDPVRIGEGLTKSLRGHLPIAAILSVVGVLALDMLVGMILMIATDMWFCANYLPSAHQVMRPLLDPSALRIDEIIGCGGGLFIGLVALGTRISPIKFGCCFALGVNILLALTLYPVYISLGKGIMNFYLGTGLSVTVFSVSILAVSLSKWLRARLPQYLVWPYRLTVERRN